MNFEALRRLFSFSNLVLFWACVFVIGLVCSKFLMSISIMLWVLTCIIHFDYRNYLQRIYQNKVFWIIAMFYFLHIISLFWTNDLRQGWDDIRVRTTLLIVPLLFVISFDAIEKNLKRLHLISLACLATVSLIQVINYFYLLKFGQLEDIRQLSVFGSHIRFGILLSFSVGIAYYAYQKKWIGFRLTLLYTIFVASYTIYSQVFSAYFALALTFIFICYQILKTYKLQFYFWVFHFALICIVLFGIGYFYQSANYKPCSAFTETIKTKKAWNSKSTFSFEGKDKKGQNLQRTMERYICSKGLELNQKGILKLSKTDVEHIENGFTDPYSASGHILSRVEEIKFQIYEAKDPNGHSFLQRIEYWKAAGNIIKKNPLLGVGIGDIDHAFKTEYLVSHSKLKLENQERSHNMFLTTWVATGLLGFILFIFLFIAMVRYGIKTKHWLLLLFICISVIGNLVEDSFETQAGASFFAFYFGLFLIPENQKNRS